MLAFDFYQFIGLRVVHYSYIVKADTTPDVTTVTPGKLGVHLVYTQCKKSRTTNKATATTATGWMCTVQSTVKDVLL